VLFDTPVYFVFLALAVLIYWRLGFRSQNRFLLIASYFFYGWWDWRFLVLMIASTTIDYWLARKIADSPDEKHRRWMFTASIVMNFGVLGFFKYFNFFIDSFAGVLTSLGIQNVPPGLLQILLPPGISFYTFQEVAYIVDVYQRKMEPSRRFDDYGLFISLFPHLIAGPIQRPSHLLPQVQHPRVYDDRKVFDGLMLIASGLFRKCVIADHCALLANAAFDGSLGHNFFSVLIGVYAFSWQIYGDFSGYSDIARGSAQLLGFHFMVNFRQPYFSSSLQDFWRRWHVSLSTWLRDYLYIPLGGNRKGNARTYINLMTTMLLGGLWHGANWTFVIWGGIHGVWLSVERFLSGSRSPEERLGWLWRPVTLLIVGLAWVFFRARSVGEAFHLLGGLGSFEWQQRYGPALIFLGAISSLAMLMDWRLERTGEEYPFEKASFGYAIGTAAALIFLIATIGANEANAFIYFQF
jgi:D-alanyl-lipoteichoic acid acyltransferase DltB (MBOAT superfamily)